MTIPGRACFGRVGDDPYFSGRRVPEIACASLLVKAWIYWQNAQMVEIVDRVSKKGNSPYISLGLFFLQHPSVFIYGERYCFLAETGRKTEGCAPGHIGWYSCLLITDKKPSESEGFLHDPPPAV